MPEDLTEKQSNIIQDEIMDDIETVLVTLRKDHRNDIKTLDRVEKELRNMFEEEEEEEEEEED